MLSKLMIYLLDERIAFPNPRNGESNGLLAVGGDLSVERLILAYGHGIFPWYDFREGTIAWWCPMRRFVIFPDEIHISHSMRSLLRKGTMTVSFNKAFHQVIAQCSQLRINETGAWLGEDMIEAYTRLHALGLAKSVEVWQDGELVGGLYGVLSGRCFCGESMFSLVPSASKVALIALARHLPKTGRELIDCQLRTPHLASMGGRYISYDEYMSHLRFS